MFKLRFLVLGMISLFIILFLINCEKDKIPIADEEGHEHIADLPFSIKSIPFHEVEEESAVRKKLDEFEKALEKERNKSNDPELCDFTIDTEFASYIKSNVSNYHSYTFAIKREYDYGPLENLLLSVQPDLSYKAFIVKYDFTLDTPMEDISEEAMNVLLFGTDEVLKIKQVTDNSLSTYSSAYEGIINFLVKQKMETLFLQ